MFGLASHLWLRDKSVSVTQLKLFFEGKHCGSFIWFKCVFFIYSHQTEKERGEGSSSRVCSQLELSVWCDWMIKRKKKKVLCTCEDFKVTWI